MDDLDTIDIKKIAGEYRNINLFIDNAKTYIQLATGALLLTVTFSHGVSGETGLPIKEFTSWISWIFWLVTIISGATYQYCATKYLEVLEQKNGSLFYHRAKPFIIFEYWIRKPYQLYGIMMLSFYGGILWFVMTAIYMMSG